MRAADELLRQWAKKCLSEAKLEAEISSDLEKTQDKPTVCLWLSDILPAAPKPVGRITPLRVTLRYHVFVQAGQRADAHAVLESLLFSAMRDTSIELQLQPVAEMFWQTMGCRPCPSFSIIVEHQQDAHINLAKPVKEPMIMRVNPTSRLHGSVMIKLNNQAVIPGHGAKLNLVNSNISTFADDKGKFTLGAIPSTPKEKLLAVQYKSYSQKLSVVASESPLEITMTTEEK